MADRRQFLAGLLAAGLTPVRSWADAGAPAFLSAAADRDGSYLLCGLDTSGHIVFRVPLPARGHAAAAHPHRPEAVAFARRPGRFATVLDCVTGQIVATLSAPDGRHFYGHGVFSQDGGWLYTTENDYEAGQGRIGIWNARLGYARAGEWASGGIGPHDIKRLPGSEVLVVANGGIDTHPDTGRTKLNIPTMAPNLSYLQDGQVIETVALPEDWHKNSIRHLAVSDTGQVAFGTQWQEDTPSPSLVGLHCRGRPAGVFAAPPDAWRAMQGYVGSIAFSGDQRKVIVTSPRGGVVQIHDVGRMSLDSSIPLPDASGVIAATGGVIVSSGTGHLTRVGAQITPLREHAELRWDNHLVALR